MTNAELQKFVIRKLGITKESFYGDGSQDCGVAFDYQGKVYLVMPDVTVHQCIPGGTHVANDYAEQLEKLLRGEQWDGTGLPPVGTECECHVDEGVIHCVVVGYDFDEKAVVMRNVPARKYFSIQADSGRIKPLRTERDKAIKQMIEFHRNTLGSHADSMRQLYDAIVAGKIDGLGKVG